MANKKIVYVLLVSICFSLAACTNKDLNKDKYTGTVECNSYYITSEISGKLNEVDLQEGSDIKKDSIAAKINPDALQLQKNQAEGALEAAQAQYDSLTSSVDDNKKKQAEGSLKQAKANYDLADLNLSKSVIKSQNDGIVADVLVNAGEIVQAGSNIAKVLDTNSKYIKIYVQESKRNAIKLNDKLNLYYNSSKVGTGKISFISPEAEFTPKNTETKDEKNNTVFEVKVKLPNDFQYSPGTLIDVEVR
ncbi:HlyD family efflux transporter periplasmic adaptor subunit [Clostridium sp. 19966]|uniref:HlyD family secretion protein n=1 Tax=Clostridium sp. 19966 TaxID=2768166 RepID=UPI0028DF7DDD|nr:HlyD family efflux transporter periplasmic adaptor subunit [Clostridium sp. 19966]MDT8716833.1 HlyD family efflux transporter periplasmic adaptor subunit [Clostridium sp. 19966]